MAETADFPGAEQDPFHVELARQVCVLIEENLEERLRLADLGARLHISPGHLQRIFKAVVGISPRQYADACRLARLKVGLKEEQTVTSAMFQAGYGSSSRLYERAASQLGMTPATYQRGGRGMHICFTVARCRLGQVLLAGTEKGVCAVSLGDDEKILLQSLKEEYPAATIEPDGAVLRPWLEELLAHLAGEQPALALPIDVQATAFQWRVWQELIRIPYGATRSYREIARAIGQPTATRAVARACATNPVAIIVPCHRVVREDGNLAGYRWGVERKEQLLEQERKTAPEPGSTTQNTHHGNR